MSNSEDRLRFIARITDLLRRGEKLPKSQGEICAWLESKRGTIVKLLEIVVGTGRSDACVGDTLKALEAAGLCQKVKPGVWCILPKPIPTIPCLQPFPPAPLQYPLPDANLSQGQVNDLTWTISYEEQVLAVLREILEVMRELRDIWIVPTPPIVYGASNTQRKP